eukprot:1227880-Ditylum_brightwellii.AAC.1
MRTVPTTSKQSNPDMKQAVILFPRPAPRQLKHCQFHAYKLCTTQADVTSPIYKLSVPFFDGGTPEEWINSDVALLQYLRAKALCKDPQVMRLQRPFLKAVPHFKLCLDDVAEHVFPEKVGQIQKSYMRRNICYGKGNAVKEWVAQVQELN